MLTPKQIALAEARERTYDQGGAPCPGGAQRSSGISALVAPMYPRIGPDGRTRVSSNPPGTAVLDLTDPENPTVTFRPDDPGYDPR